MDALEYLKFLSALLFVLALIVGCAWLLKRSGVIPAALMGRRADGKRRLDIVEVLPLDARRRLVLVRRDEAEHLLLLGTQSDLVVERNIGASAPVSAKGTKSARSAKGTKKGPS